MDQDTTPTNSDPSGAASPSQTSSQPANDSSSQGGGQGAAGAQGDGQSGAPSTQQGAGQDAGQTVIMQDPGRDMTSTGEPIVENEYASDEDFEAALESSLKAVRENDIVEGVVVKVDPDEALLDIGYKSEGVIPARELSIKQDVDPREVVQIGDVIEALVMQKEDAEGRLLLSKKRAQYERAWGTIERIFNEDKTVRGTVIEVVKGGLILDIGLRGFLPASLVEMRRVRDLNPYVGTELECKIIELDKNRNNVVLSRRKFLEETQSEFRQEFLSSLEVGEIRKGTVSSIVNFGAFVDLGGVDGLVHVSELAWQHIDHPSEIVEVGDEVEIEVLDVDLERERVSLSLKATQEDPWTKFARENDVGDIIEGEVTKLVPFGAFVAVAEGIEGLVHISELADHHVEAPESVVNVGEKIDIKVIDIDTVRRRISLSLKQVGGPSQAPSGGPAGGGDQLTPEQIALAETAYVSGEGRPGQAAGQSSALGDQLRQAGFAATEEEAAAEETAAEEAAAEEPAASEAADEEAAPEESAAEESAEEESAEEEPADEQPAPEEAAAEEPAAEEAAEEPTAETAAATADDTTAEPATEEAPEEPAEEPEAPAEVAPEEPEATLDAGDPALEGELAGQAEASEEDEAAPAGDDVSGADVSDIEAEVPEDTEEQPSDESPEAPAAGIAQADEESDTEEPEEAPTSSDSPTGTS